MWANHKALTKLLRKWKHFWQNALWKKMWPFNSVFGAIYHFNWTM